MIVIPLFHTNGRNIWIVGQMEGDYKKEKLLV
jgi:hypothetical protein